MAGGRNTTPLFDLLSRTGRSSGTGAEGARAAKPVVRVELKAQDPDHAAPIPAREPDVAPLGDAVLAGSTVRVPVNIIYFGTAGLILALIIVWVGGYKWGQVKEGRRVDEALAGLHERPQFTDPLNSSEPPSSASGSVAAQPPPNAVQKPIERPIEKAGLSQDPREKDKNYLALATVPRQEAEACVRFLAENGVQGFAVPVESRTGGANNPGPGGLYQLYALPGITSEQYRRNETVKTNLEATVAKLGARWQSQYRGGTSFATARWYKF